MFKKAVKQLNIDKKTHTHINITITTTCRTNRHTKQKINQTTVKHEQNTNKTQKPHK